MRTPRSPGNNAAPPNPNHSSRGEIREHQKHLKMSTRSYYFKSPCNRNSHGNSDVKLNKAVCYCGEDTVVVRTVDCRHFRRLFWWHIAVKMTWMTGWPHWR
jgi:hypothetical protein